MFRMNKVFRGNRKDQRVIIEDAQHLRFDEQDIDAYIKEDNDTKAITLQIFEGNKAKPTIYSRYRTMGLVEEVIQERVRLVQSRIDYKVQQKIEKKQRQNELKKALVPGELLRTSFSYNMTFNHFYKVISNKRNTYKLEVLGTEWVDGDIGWTGNVKCGSETGKFVEGKLTANGLKIDNLYADVVDAEDTFYENHMD